VLFLVHKKKKSKKKSFWLAEAKFSDYVMQTEDFFPSLMLDDLYIFGHQRVQKYCAKKLL